MAGASSSRKTAVTGSSVVTYTGGTVAAASSCTVSVDVAGVAPGAHVNTSGDLPAVGSAAPSFSLVGSDLGNVQLRAWYDEEAETWRLRGVKRFITSAEHDMSENIVHMVLARPQGVEGVGGPGTKGLSLFVVPSVYRIVKGWELGRRGTAAAAG
mgnify:CR=1 FL=1